ncbi:SpoIID/LytB domain protein [Xenococcus sp. PCC 7305]|uniref:SpoIID/LytB domain-containing protein n=1 Tax=Xenococcus sp. PCC 7305 TaxID=102125 RepID=UPI0002AC6C1E|nr:SpoIID/LytB domain-containing protein [Xenococcus sp. PCC 7305]ELS04524.1 SpoIID/LytB domain protein [Xenococcus sp. PCC 7305]
MESESVISDQLSVISYQLSVEKMIYRSFGILVFGLVVGAEAVLATGALAQEPELKVGIIQRFGDELVDEKDEIVERIEITSTTGDWLTISSLDGQQNPENTTEDESQTVKSKKIILQTIDKPLDEPIVSERVILGNYSTFETAENNANFWRSVGLAVEIVQPGRWQVWAKRDVYDSPIIRRLLLQSLADNGYDAPYLESELLSTIPQVTINIDGTEYHDNEIAIDTQKSRVRVQATSNKSQTNRIYGGSLQLQPNAYGNFTLVNHVPLETYLRGVVPYEIGANAPQKAIASQTIIARTYALRNLRRFVADDYELCATIHCQVYKGLSGATKRTDQAIANTKGLVLTYENELVDALYSSTTGGVGASFSDVWEGEERPYLIPVIDAPSPLWDLDRYPLSDESLLRRFLSLTQGFNETGTSRFRWDRTSKLTDLNDDFRRYLTRTNHPLVNFTTITNLEVTERSRSGRIITLLVTTDLGNIKLFKNEVRSAFGPPISTLFYLDPVYNQANELEAYAFIGGGFGHGVGLSQFGSYNLARLGWSANQILAFYYPGTKIEPLNDDIIFFSQSE